jgi:hypothetical protein
MSRHKETSKAYGKPCKDCGGTPRYRSAVCQECYYRRLREKNALALKDKLCPFCSKTFKANRLKHRKFCSSECRSRAGYTTPWGKIEQTRRCKECSADFQQKTPWQQFCSDKCSEVSRSRRRHPPVGRKAVELLHVKCRECGKEFTQPKRYYQSGIKHRTPKYCSLQCAYVARRGMASPLYREPAKGTRGIVWLKLAREIRKRDDYLCLACGERAGIKAHVDHVLPERLMRLWKCEPHHADNLVTLCNSCHTKKTHIEQRLFRGDFVGFRSEVKTIGYPMDAVERAFRFSAGYAPKL